MTELGLPGSSTDTIGLESNTAKQKILNTLIDKKVLNMEAVTQKIEIEPNIIDNIIQSEIMAYGSEEKYRKQLRMNGISEKDHKQELADQLKIRTLLERNVYLYLKPITLDEAQAYYQSHLSEFRVGERVRFRYIFISTSRETTEDGKAKKLQKAQQVLEKIKKGGDFAKLAEENSESDRAPFGGDIGRFIHVGELKGTPEVEQAAFSLNDGQTSDLITTPEGYFIVKIDQKEQGVLRDFEKAKIDILEKLVKKKAEDRYNEWFSQVKSKYQIEIFPENF